MTEDLARVCLEEEHLNVRRGDGPWELHEQERAADKGSDKECGELDKDQGPSPFLEGRRRPESTNNSLGFVRVRIIAYDLRR